MEMKNDCMNDIWKGEQEYKTEKNFIDGM